jgi:hypothetical protein
MTQSLFRSAATPVISAELQSWLEWRDTHQKLKLKYQKNHALIALLPETLEPHNLPDPLRSEALAYLRTPEKKQITTREGFLKAFQLKVKYI